MTYLKKQYTQPAAKTHGLYLKAGHPAFKAAFDNAKDAVLATHGCDTPPCYANRSACRITEYSFNELMNIGLAELVHPQELCKLEAQLDNQQKGEKSACCFETRIVTKSGKTVPVEVTITIDQPENSKLSFAIIRDIRREKHARKAMKASLHLLNDELVRNQAEWESLNRELLETHKAMSVLAKNIDSEKFELEKKVNTAITAKVMPIIKELLTNERIKRFWPEINSMAEHLNAITTHSDLHSEIINVLTETEMKIAAMVKNKMSSKEIASIMYISLETVKAHRKNIRRKLKIHNTRHKLSEYLATVMGG